ILKGVTIGEGAIIGASSVVVADVPPYTVAAGNPARVVKDLRAQRPASEATPAGKV
ncbi:MAG: acyltransferase, partial [Bryobacteraceae bacterium]